MLRIIRDVHEVLGRPPIVLNTLQMSRFSLTFVFFSFGDGEGEDKITKRDLCLVINCVGHFIEIDKGKCMFLAL